MNARTFFTSNGVDDDSLAFVVEGFWRGAVDEVLEVMIDFGAACVVVALVGAFACLDLGLLVVVEMVVVDEVSEADGGNFVFGTTLDCTVVDIFLAVDLLTLIVAGALLLGVVLVIVDLIQAKCALLRRGVLRCAQYPVDKVI